MQIFHDFMTNQTQELNRCSISNKKREIKSHHHKCKVCKCYVKIYLYK